MKNLTCKICKLYKDKVSSSSSVVQREWINGSTNYKISNVKDHSKPGSPHETALKLYKHDNDIKMNEEGQDTFDTSFAKGDKMLAEMLKKKFEVSYFVAKEELSLLKYERIINLEEMHRVKFGDAYRNRPSCGEFIDYVGEDIGDTLNKDLAQAKYFSALSEGSTDSTSKEQECVFALHFDPKLSDKEDRVEVKMSFLGLKELNSADSGASVDGVVNTITGTFESLGITNYNNKLIGFGANGASVNRGNKNGVKKKLREIMPWLIFNWCLSHRLELAIEEVLKGTGFGDVDKMLLGLYYIDDKSPKKLSELTELFQHMKDMQVDDFELGTVKPIRACGTRWISHKLAAMCVAFDKYGLFISHIKEMSQDKSCASSARAKMTGYLRSWNRTAMIVKLGFYIDMLEPISKLSLALQSDEIDPVQAIEAMGKISEKLLDMKEKDVSDYLSILSLKRRISDIEGR